MLEEVQKVLSEVRPFLQRDGGDVEFVELTPDNIVRVRMRGACGTCPGAIMTLKGGIERVMKQRIPAIIAVESVA